MNPAGSHPIDQALAVIAADPSGASALTLYALASTLEFPRAGCLFKLTKLHDLEPQHRPVAYGLMECLVQGQVGTPQWLRAKARMDALIRGNAIHGTAGPG